MQSSPLPPGGYGPQAGQTIYYGQPYSPYVGMPPQGADEQPNYSDGPFRPRRAPRRARGIRARLGCGLRDDLILEMNGSSNYDLRKALAGIPR